MKLNYDAQLTISFVLVILGNILTDIFDFWLYRSLAFIICGLLFIAHPVVPNYLETNKKTVFWTRIAGVILVLIGGFTRVHY